MKLSGFKIVMMWWYLLHFYYGVISPGNINNTLHEFMFLINPSGFCAFNQPALLLYRNGFPFHRTTEIVLSRYTVYTRV